MPDDPALPSATVAASGDRAAPIVITANPEDGHASVTAEPHSVDDAAAVRSAAAKLAAKASDDAPPAKSTRSARSA